MSALRRVANPSPSTWVAVNAIGLVASSTRVIRRSATCSPSRLANSERPFSTASPDKVLDSTPRNWAVTNGSSTTVVRRLVGGTGVLDAHASVGGQGGARELGGE